MSSVVSDGNVEVVDSRGSGDRSGERVVEGTVFGTRKGRIAASAAYAVDWEHWLQKSEGQDGF